MPGFVSNVEAAWGWPNLARFLHRLASVSRLIVFDKRGTGLSDPMTRAPTLEERMDDIRAVMDAAGVERAPLLGVSEGGALSIGFASEHPDRVEALVLYGSYAKKLATDDYPWGVTKEQLELFKDSFDDAWATGRWWDIVHPEASTDAASRERWARYLRASASPGMARNLMEQNALIDVRPLLPAIAAPTLVLHRTDDHWVDVGNARFLAANIAGATLVELEGSDHRPWLGDADPVLDQIDAFVTGGQLAPTSRAGAPGRRGAQPPRTRDRVAGRRRPVHEGDRLEPVPERADDRDAPGQRVREARRPLAGRAGPQGR